MYLTAANDLAIRRALEAAGVEFIDENGVGPGVRLRNRQRAKQPKKAPPPFTVPCASTLMRIQSACENAGIRFLDNDAAGGIGVRFAVSKP
jgi:hypothetical protein